MDSDLEKNFEMIFSGEYKKRKLWIYRRKVISVDDEYITFDDRGIIHRWDIDEECFRTREYREWLVDSGYWIPSMDLRESWFDVSAKRLTEEEEKQLGIKSGTENENKEDLSIRMKKLKVEQQGKFKKYYERQVLQKELQKEKMKKSKNSKSKNNKSKGKLKRKPDPSKAKTRKIEKPKLQESKEVMVKKEDPWKTPDPKKPENAADPEAREEKIKKQDPPKSEDPVKKEDPPKIEDLKAQDPKKTEGPTLKEIVRSHYCYTEMHLVSGKEIKKKN